MRLRTKKATLFSAPFKTVVIRLRASSYSVPETLFDTFDGHRPRQNSALTAVLATKPVAPTVLVHDLVSVEQAERLASAPINCGDKYYFCIQHISVSFCCIRPWLSFKADPPERKRGSSSYPLGLEYRISVLPPC